MIKTELETLLESGLGSVGIKLMDRVYYEDLHLQATIDDKKKPGITVSMARLMRRKTHRLGPYGRFLADISLYRNLSEAQMMEYDKLIPAFVRESTAKDDFFVRYEIFAKDELQHYRGHLDALIKEGKIGDEYIIIYYKNGLRLLRK